MGMAEAKKMSSRVRVKPQRTRLACGSLQNILRKGKPDVVRSHVPRTFKLQYQESIRSLTL